MFEVSPVTPEEWKAIIEVTVRTLGVIIPIVATSVAVVLKLKI